MRIVHFSDIHAGLFPRRVSALTDKRLLGALNYLLRRRRDCHPERIERFTARVAALRPDWVVCSGDLSSIGSPEEFALAQAWLQPLRDLVGERFIYVPGNHDAYVRDAVSRQALAASFRELNSQRWQLHDLPLAISCDHAQLILIPGARPVGLLRSSGQLASDECARLTTILAKPRPPELLRVGISHFPPCRADGRPLASRRALQGADALLAHLQAGRLDVLLSGHIHRAYGHQLPTGALVLCAGSLTLTGSFLVLDYEPGQACSWQIHTVDELAATSCNPH
jgi:predicted phosphodiesterase